MKNQTLQKLNSQKEAILGFYQDHSADATSKKFGFSRTTLTEWLTSIGQLRQDKTPKQIRKENLARISKEMLEELYIKQNLSKEEVAKQLEITIWSLSELFKAYGIRKNLSDVVDLRKSTNLDKYGVDNPRKAESIKSKIRVTNENRYGATTFTASSAGKQQVAQTKLEHWGDSKYNNSAQNKTTKAERYGNPHYNNRDKNNQTCMERYGVKHGGLLEGVTRRNREARCEALGYSKLFKSIYADKEAAVKYLQSLNRPTIFELMEYLELPYYTVEQWILRWELQNYISYSSGSSHYEKEIIQYLETLDVGVIEQHNRSILKGSELDIYLPEFKLGLEFNGDYWHSNVRRPSRYHFNKSFQCEQQGIRLIHIYEHQWVDPVKQEILKSIIRNALGKNSSTIYARKCEIRELKKGDVEEFSNHNSLHGHRNASIYLGLFYQGELVELMSFGKAFFSKDDSIDYECIRSITRLDTTVVGGMNRLFRYFVHRWDPLKVLYYVDYNTHLGTSMNNLGFKFHSYSKYGIINVANCKEVEDRFGKVFGRKPMQNKEIQQLSQEGKVFSIYDAGVKKYIWTNKE